MKKRSEQLMTRLAELHQHGWQLVDEHHLEKTFVFPDWTAALGFVNRIGDAADRLHHHPDVELSWGRVVVKLRTYDENDVGELDVQLANIIEAMKL